MTEEAQELLEKLPEILRQSPELRHKLYDLLSAEFVPRREMAEILAELKASREEARERFEAMDRRFDEAGRRDQDTRDWVGVVVGGFQTRAGRNLEDAVAGTLRVALRMKDLDPETIKLRQKVEDPEGLIGPPGRSYEYDIFVTNGETCVFEVESVPDTEDVDRFADKCDLVAQTLGLEHVRRVIVTLAKTPNLRRYCEERDILLA